MVDVSERRMNEESDVGAWAGFPDFADRGPFRFISGLTPHHPELAGREASDPIFLAEGPYRSQAQAILDRLGEITSDTGTAHTPVLRQHMYQHDKRRFPILEKVRDELEDVAAPSSGIGLTTLREPHSLYELDAIALNPKGLERYGPRRLVETSGVGPAAALYSQAVATGPYVFTAGMLGLTEDKSDAIRRFDEIPEEGRWLQRGRSHPDHRMGPVVTQTWAIYSRVMELVQSVGLAASNVCQVTIFLHDTGDFADAYRVHQRWFGDNGPAVNVIQVDEVGHKGTVVEVEFTLFDGKVTSKVAVPATFGVSSVVESGDLIIFSDHLPIGPDGHVDPPAPDHVEKGSVLDRETLDETAQRHGHLALQQLRETVNRAGLSPECIGHLQIQLARGATRSWLEAPVLEMFGDASPAITVLEVPAISQSPHAMVSVSASGAHRDHR